MKASVSKLDREQLIFTLASVLRAQAALNLDVLHSVSFWWEESRLKLFYHLKREGSEDEIEELDCMTTEIMCDFEITMVDQFFDTEPPTERDNMIVWIANSGSSTTD